MKKCFVCAFALALALGVSASAFAKDGLSVGFGLGIKDNPSSLDGTVNHDGLAGTGTAPDSEIGYRSLYSTANLETMKKNGTISSFEDNGTMKSVDFAINVRYDFMDYMFVRLGADYNMSLLGGEKSWKYTDAATNMGEMTVSGQPLATAAPYSVLMALSMNPATATAANNFMAAIYAVAGSPGAYSPAQVAAGAFGQKFATGPGEGAKASQNWSYYSYAIPVTFGFNLPINDGKYNVYVGIGMVYAAGKWSVDCDAPANAYFNSTLVQEIVTQYAVQGAAGAVAFGGVTSLNTSDAAKEKFEFETRDLGLQWLIGIDAEVAPQISVFFEVETQMAASISKSHEKGSAGYAALGPDSYVTYTNIPGGQIFRIGGKYTLGQVF